MAPPILKAKDGDEKEEDVTPATEEEQKEGI